MQAVIILAHKNEEQVLKLANKLNKRFEIYIHFDKKMYVSKNLIKELDKNGIHHYSEIEVNWGSWSIGKAAYIMMNYCLENPKIEYIHLISGQDWPIKNIDEIYARFDGNDHIYMISSKAKNKIKSHEKLIWWQKFYFNYDVIKRRTIFGKFYHRLLIGIQLLFRIDKLKKLNLDIDIYTGSNWVDIPRYAAEYSVEYLKSHPNLIRMLETGAFSDEFWLQTILSNSKYKKNIVNDNLRYIVWKKKHGSRPAILDIEDYEDIRNTDAIFARKVDKKISRDLISKIECDVNPVK